MIADPICDLLLADANVTALLAKYDFGAGDEPAIFDYEPAPPCPQPLITVVEGGGPGTEGARDTRGFRMRATVTIWGNKDHGRAKLRDLALLCWRALDRQDLTLRNPYCETGFWVDPWRELTDEDGFPGIQIPATVLVLEGSGAL